MDNPILALIASFIAMSFAVSSYFVKRKSWYLAFQASCITFLIVSYFFTLQFFAMVGLAIGLLRAIIFFVYERQEKTAPMFIPVIISVATLLSYFIVNWWILQTVQPLDILCLAACILYAFIFRIRNLKTVRYCVLAPTVLSLLFNILTHAALFATLSYLFELLANFVAIYKYHIKKEKSETADVSKEYTYEKH